MKKTIWLCSLIFTFYLLPVEARTGLNQDSVKILELEQKIEQLSAQIDTVSQHQIKDEQLSKRIKEVTDIFKNPALLLKNVGIIALAVLGLTWLAFFIIDKFSPKWYVKFIQNLVERYEEVNVLKRKKHIMVLSSAADCKNMGFIDSFFKEKEFNFKKQSGLEFKAPEEVPDIFFANNENALLDQGILEKYLIKYPRTVLFYYGAPGSWKFTPPHEDPHKINSRINLANSRAQVYGNLISTLKYHDLVISKVAL